MHPKELQKLLAKMEGTPEEDLISQTDAALHETGKIYDGVYRTFWTGRQVLLPFYIADPPISGSADPSYHQGTACGDSMNETRRIEHYRDDSAGGGDSSPVEMERRADEAERETDKLKKVEYMSRHIGEDLRGC